MSLSFYFSSTNVSMNHNLISCSRWFSWLLSHVSFPVALHIPNVIHPPRHHERVHRHMPAQPRREASRSVCAAACVQCFQNPLHVLPTIRIKRQYSEICNRGGYKMYPRSLWVLTPMSLRYSI